ncbi:MAG: hypothetical protein KF838_06035 [Phycisphaeraceae bacterium]|nr:MAG: hypothetical protein KF838_06035 [Phycisphaeraceae bacterium]
MFEVVLSILAAAFAAWGLLGPKYTEKIRAKMRLRPGWLIALGLTALGLTVVHPFVHAAIDPACQSWRDWALAMGQLLVVVCFGLASWLVWPLGKWTEAEIQSFHQRVESLILTGRADIVVDVLDAAFPDLPPRAAEHDPARTPTEFEEAYDAVLEDALVHVEFIRAAARHKRSFLARLFTHESRAGLNASARILHELMFGPDRLLPLELSATTNFSDRDDPRHHYWIPERCIILHALFDNIIVADRLKAWQPIGNGVMNHLASMAGKSSADPDQRTFSDQYEAVRWTSPVGAGIWFFRVMASSAATQNHIDHMSIEYLSHFVDEIEPMVEIPAKSNANEFANPYCYWIYDCLQCCSDVVTASARLADSQAAHTALDPDDEETHTTLKGAIYTLGLCLAAVVKSSRLPERLKMGCTGALCMHFTAWCSKKYPNGMEELALRILIAGMSREERDHVAHYVGRIALDNPHLPSHERLRAHLVGDGPE